MSDDDAEKTIDQANADAIRRDEATQIAALGNVHSEPDGPTDQYAPPPLPN